MIPPFVPTQLHSGQRKPLSFCHISSWNIDGVIFFRWHSAVMWLLKTPPVHHNIFFPIYYFFFGGGSGDVTPLPFPRLLRLWLYPLTHCGAQLECIVQQRHVSSKELWYWHGVIQNTPSLLEIIRITWGLRATIHQPFWTIIGGWGQMQRGALSQMGAMIHPLHDTSTPSSPATADEDDFQ